MENVNEMSLEQLEAVLKSKRKEKDDQVRKERERYENFMYDTTEEIVNEAIELSRQSEIKRDKWLRQILSMREMKDKYGDIRSNSKGGFHHKTRDGNFKFTYSYKAECEWDERAEKAEELLKDFLKDTVKKRDLTLYELLMALLEKNKEGNMEYGRIQSLYSQENKFDDPRWKEAIRLFKESFRVSGSCFNLTIHKRDETTKRWELIPLGISSL